MQFKRLKPFKGTDVHTLQSKYGAFDIDKKTGWIRGCRWLSSGVDLFGQVRGGIPGYIGGLRVYDELDRVWYSDLESEFTVSLMKRTGNAVHFRKLFRNAPFKLDVTIAVEDDCLHWEVEAVKRPVTGADRSLRVHFFLPLIAGWDVWAPCRHGEATFDGMTPFEFMYLQTPYVSGQEIILPMMSHYNRALDVGYSVVEPIDENVPAAKFAFSNAEKCYNWGSMRKDVRDVPVLEAVNYYIGLVGSRKMRTKIMLFMHGGGWRPGLGMVYDRWREHFDPFNDAIYDREGVFMCGGIQAADDVDEWKRMGLKTLEVHGHFQDYCDYYQDGRDEWYTIRAKEMLRRRLLEEMGRDDREGWQEGAESDLHEVVEEFIATHTDEEFAEKIGCTVAELRHHRDDVKARLQKLADAGISCHWYFNYTDGYRARVEKEWPDSISYAEDGEPVPSGWYMCHNMNADPRWSFGQFSYESARKIFDEYPMLDGFFLDCFRHYDIDFGHDDGVTVVNSKPAYSINHSYMDIERRIKTEIMGPRNLTSFANKPMSIRSMRYCDGQLLEGDGDTYEEKFFWASISNPMFFMWTSGKADLDENLRRAVLHGCFPRQDKLEEEVIRLYQRYLPLYGQFSRRVYCFEPDPLRVPAGSRGKLYTVPDGYVAGLTNLNTAAEDEVKWGRRPYALFRVARGHDVKRAGVMYPGDGELRAAEFRFDGTFVGVPLDVYKNCAVVKLFVEGESGKEIGPDIFDQRGRMCADPDSAFEDISER